MGQQEIRQVNGDEWSNVLLATVCRRLLMSLGREVHISARVCDERPLFEYETLQSGHELTATHRLDTDLRPARTRRVLLSPGDSLTVLATGKPRVVNSTCLPLPQSWS